MTTKKVQTPSSKSSVSKSVEIRKITNGYIVSRWGPKGSIEKFAKTKQETKQKAGGMF